MKKNLLAISISLLFLTGVIGIGCFQGETLPSDDNDDEEPNNPCDITEVEINDSFDTANFIDILPVLNPALVCGVFEDVDLYSTSEDFFFFFLNPTPGDTEILINLVVEAQDNSVVPVIHLWQTMYDDLGNKTGAYQPKGSFFGNNGMLVILDYPIPYDFIQHNDLFVQLEAIITHPLVDPTYTMEYFTE